MSPSRRDVLVGGGAGCSFAVAVMLAGCGRGEATGPATPSTSRPVDRYPGDLALVALGGALDELAVTAYDVATATVSRPPDVFAQFLATARAHHAAHAAAWQKLLAASGAPPVAAVDVTQAAGTLAALQAATAPRAAAAALLTLERALAATALALAGQRTDGLTTTVATTVAPVEAQHTAVLALLLGGPAAPAALLSSSGAAGTGDLQVAPA